MKKKVIMIIILIIFLSPIVGLFFVKIKFRIIPETLTIYDENNILIGDILPENNFRHKKIKIEYIPEFSKKVIVSLEDSSFYSNIGIDFSSIFRAFLKNITNFDIVEGASTISSQVIRNNYWLNEKRTYFKKIQEFYLAVSLNIHYSKNEILENYLNTIYFGYLNYGISSASLYYFGKDVNNLTKAEQIALLIIPKNPNIYNPYKNKSLFYNRFYNTLNILYEKGLINENEYIEIKNEKLDFKIEDSNLMPYVIDFLKIENEKSKMKNNGKINTTINYNLTKKIDEIAKNTINEIRWKNVSDFSILVVDRKTNDIKVFIGGEDYYKEEGQVNMVTSLRQAGSSIKPFTYLLAFRDLGYTPSSTIIDEPVQFLTKDEYAYNPKNYSLDYKGEVSLAEALSQSINIPAIKLANEIGTNKLLDFLRQVGFSSLNESSDYYGLALTLGVGEVSLYELLRAYTIFANDGKLCDFNIIQATINPPPNPLPIKEVGLDRNINQNKCIEIIDKKYSDMVVEILTNRYFKLRGFPINSSLDFSDRTVFVKTGTSRNFRDNWTIGFTNKYLIGVWVGNKNATEMKGVSGSSGAGEIFRKLVYLLETENEKQEIITLEKNNNLKFLTISSPLNLSKYKIDTLKPKENQKIKLVFNTNMKYDSFVWKINGKKVDDIFWQIEKGNFEIKLELFKKGEKVGEEISKIFVEK